MYVAGKVMELKLVITKELEALPIELLRKLVTSIPNRVGEVSFHALFLNILIKVYNSDILLYNLLRGYFMFLVHNNYFVRLFSDLCISRVKSITGSYYSILAFPITFWSALYIYMRV